MNRVYKSTGQNGFHGAENGKKNSKRLSTVRARLLYRWRQELEFGDSKS